MYQFTEELRKHYESMLTPLAYYQVKDDGLVALLVSDGLCELMGVEREKLLSILTTSRLELLHPQDAAKTVAAMKAFVRKEGFYDQIYRTRYARGSMYHYVHSYGTWQTMPDGTELNCILYLDMTRCMDETNKLTEDGKLFQKDLFYSDSLTGLPNLNYMIQFAEERVNSIRRLGGTPVLIYADVISMQYYNSQYGFEEGNKLLCQVAGALQEAFPGTLLIRGADDHFILIDAFESEEQTEEKIARADRMIQKNAAGNTTGIKAGACVYQDRMTTIVAMDHARDAIKWLGNDLNHVCHFYTRVAEDQSWNQRYIIDSFERALEDHWIKVYYQGISRTKTGKSTAYEALARWVDPIRGFLSPAEFIPVLEKYHLLHRLDLYMAEQVCMDMPMRRVRGLPVLPVTVNFAAQDFDYEDIPTKLNEIYNCYCPNLYPEKKYLIVEITEQDMTRATDRFHEQIRRLKQLGFRVWLDDFGSGYSSLNAFSRFDVDLIKFDMDLLRNLDDNNGANRRIMNAMVQVAREMGIHTLAEGLETEQQRAFLQEIGCELAQGYLYHRPEPLETTYINMEAGKQLRPFETPDERDQLSRKWLDENEHSLAVIEQFGDHMPGGFFICKADESGELLYANNSMCKLYGCEDLDDFKAYTGFNLRGMVHPDDSGVTFTTIRKRANGYKPNTDYLEYRIIRKDGEVRWLNEYNYFVHSELHKDLYYVFLSDITEQRQKEQSEKLQRSAVIEALTKAYDSVWIIEDMQSQRFELFRVDQTLAHALPASEAIKNAKFSDALAVYSRLVLEEDRAALLEAASPESIERYTKERLFYSVLFRRVFETGPRYYRIEFTRMELKNGETNIVAGFRDVDDEVRREQGVQHSLKLRAACIEALTQTYESVWFINDYETQSYELFRIDESRKHVDAVMEAAKCKRYTDALACYAKVIVPEDRKAFLEAITPEKIRDEMQDKVIYGVPFRRMLDGGIRYYRMEFCKLDMGSEASVTVVGFRNVDDEVRKTEEIQDALRMRAAVIEALTKAYDSVWIIKDLETQRFELFRVDPKMAHMLPAQAAAKRIRFTDALAVYSRLIVKEDRAGFLDAVTPEAIAKHTKEKTIYSVPFRRVFENEIRHYRMEFTTMKLETGETNIVVGFRDVEEFMRYSSSVQGEKNAE